MFENLNWGSQLGGRNGGVDVPYRGAIPDRPTYLPQSPDNARATARPVCDNILQEHRLARAQSLSDSRHILRDQLFNWTGCTWDDLWDEPFVE